MDGEGEEALVLRQAGGRYEVALTVAVEVREPDPGAARVGGQDDAGVAVGEIRLPVVAADDDRTPDVEIVVLGPASQLGEATLDKAIEAVGAERAAPVAAQNTPGGERRGALGVSLESGHVLVPLRRAFPRELVEGGLVLEPQ